VEVDLADTINHILVLEGDESEATVALRLLVHQHDRLLDGAELAEVGLDLLGGGVLRDAAHEDLLGLVGLSGSVLWGGMFGVDLLAIECVNGHLEDLFHGAGFLECDETKAATAL